MFVQTVNEQQEAKGLAYEKFAAVIEKYSDRPIGMSITFNQCRHLTEVSVKVKAGPVFSVMACDKAASVFEAIDLVALKLDKQLRRRKKKLVKRQSRFVPLKLVEDHWADHEDDLSPYEDHDTYDDERIFSDDYSKNAGYEKETWADFSWGAR